MKIIGHGLTANTSLVEMTDAEYKAMELIQYAMIKRMPEGNPSSPFLNDAERAALLEKRAAIIARAAKREL